MRVFNRSRWANGYGRERISRCSGSCPVGAALGMKRQVESFGVRRQRRAGGSELRQALAHSGDLVVLETLERKLQSVVHRGEVRTNLAHARCNARWKGTAVDHGEHLLQLLVAGGNRLLAARGQSSGGGRSERRQSVIERGHGGR